MCSALGHPPLDFVPLLAPDETLFSFFARASSLGSYGDARLTRGDYSGRKAGLVFDFPYDLERLTHVMPVGERNAEQLARAATCLPFFTRFRTSAVAMRAVQILCASSIGLLKHDLGLRASACGSTGAIKTCPECMEQDMGEYGTAYWHRSLQLPGVNVCPTHEVVLLQAKSMRGGKQQTFFLPHQITYAKTDDANLGPKAHARALQFSRLATAALQNQLPGEFDSDALYHTYRTALRAEGLVSKSGRLRLAELEVRLGTHIEGLQGGLKLCRPEVSREVIALISILRSRSETFNTVPHLVLIEMLFDSWKHFAAMYEWQRALSLSSISNGDKVAPTLLALQAASKVAVVRKGSRWVEATARIEHYVRQHPQASRLRVKIDTGSDWRWLYRNDPTWLTSNTPPSRPAPARRPSWVNWSDRDDKLRELIVKERIRVTTLSGCRITPANILRELGVLPFSIQLQKMPRTVALLEEIVKQLKNKRT